MKMSMLSSHTGHGRMKRESQEAWRDTWRHAAVIFPLEIKPGRGLARVIAAISGFDLNQ